MNVSGLTIDPTNNAPIVLLRESKGSRVLPIWIGVIEASAIAFELENVTLTRPMTHDLLKSVIDRLGGRMERASIADLKDNTYFAVIAITREGERMEIDARPSDAIALALRAKAPIYCDADILAQAHVREASGKSASGEGVSVSSAAQEEDVDRGEGGPKPIIASGEVSYEEVLENLDPDAFGKYKM